MHADLERLIRLQGLDLELQDLRRTIDTESDRRLAAEAALETLSTDLTQARERLSTCQNGRRAIEKDLAQVQGRLSRYRDQLMEVKTNKEYAAMQTEIAAAEAEVRKLEDEILERMVEADEMTAAVKAAELALTRGESETKVAIQGLSEQTSRARERLVAASAARSDVAASLSPAALALYEHIASHRGTAVVEARDGHCSLCHVRLRPKVYQDVRRNDSVIQCDSCQRILYHAPNPNQAAPRATA